MDNSPTYQVVADNSDIKGTISFSARDDGYYGTIVLTNFPEGYIKTSTLVTSPIADANYETLKIEALKLGQANLDELKTDTVNFGILKIVSSAEESAIRFIDYKTEGKIIDHEDNPLPEATIKDTRDNQATSEITGVFILEGDYISGSIFEINISAEGYGTKYGVKPFEMVQQQAMNKIITTVKTVLIPAILTQLAAFGISKASEAINKKFGDLNITCPTNLDELNRLIRKKNKLTKQLNNIYKFLNGVKIGVQILDGTLTAAN